MFLRIPQSVSNPRVGQTRQRQLRTGPVKTNGGVMSARTRNTGTLIVLAHLAVLLAHGSGHAHLGIGTNAWQSAFIAIVIFALPLIAMVLLWTRVQMAGVLLLGSAMAGALAFGLYYHFVATGADNALGLRQSDWSTAFLATAVLLAVVEAVACGWCFLVLRSRR